MSFLKEGGAPLQDHFPILLKVKLYKQCNHSFWSPSIEKGFDQDSKVVTFVGTKKLSIGVKTF